MYHQVVVLTVVSFLAAAEVRCACPNPPDLPTRTRAGRSMCARYYRHSHWEQALSCGGTNVDVYNGEATGVMPPGGWNDEISSVVVRPGCTFRGYKDGRFRGRRRSFTGQNYRLRNQGWNDKISSYGCTCVFNEIDCRPRDEWEVVLSCDATSSGTDIQCQHRLLEGTALGSSITNGGSMSTSVTASVGLELEGVFSASLSVSRATEYNWSRSTSATRTMSTTQVITANAPAGKVAKIHQVIGRCGDTAVYTERFRVTTA